MTFYNGSTPAVRVVDTNRKLTSVPGVLSAVLAAGYAGVIRYVPLPGNSASGDIDGGELQAILGAGLGLMLVQHPRYPGWSPAAEDGEKDAATALASATSAGYIPGAHIFLDLEGLVAGATADATMAFANAWAKTIVAAGYKAGCYVGFDVPLNAAQLYSLPNVDSYWSDSGSREVATRGFAMTQGAGIVISGVAFDQNVVAPDKLGQTPIWMSSSPPTSA